MIFANIFGEVQVEDRVSRVVFPNFRDPKFEKMDGFLKTFGKPILLKIEPDFDMNFLFHCTAYNED